MPVIIRQIIPDIHDIIIYPYSSNQIRLNSFKGGVAGGGGGLTIAGVVVNQGVNTIYTDSASDYLISCNTGTGAVTIGSTPFSSLTTGYNDGTVLSLFRTDNSSWWNFTSPVVKDYRNSLIISGDFPIPYNVGGSMHTIGQGFHARHVGFCTLGSDRKPGSKDVTVTDNQQRYFAVISAFENYSLNVLKNPGTTGWQTLTQDTWETLINCAFHFCLVYGMTIHVSAQTLIQNNSTTPDNVKVKINNYAPNESIECYLGNTSSGYSPMMPFSLGGDKIAVYLNQPNYGVIKFQAYATGGGTSQYNDLLTQIIITRSGKPVRDF